MKYLFIVLIICTSALFCNTALAQSGFDDGLKDFDDKNYKKSFAILKPYAEKGNCLAQFVIGFSFQYGLSVSANDSLARHWLLLSAEQKQPDAMGPLAVNYFMGSSKTPQPDPDLLIKAYQWAMLAVEYSPAQMATSTRYLVKGYLKPDQLEKANKLIDDYKQKWNDKENCR